MATRDRTQAVRLERGPWDYEKRTVDGLPRVRRRDRRTETRKTRSGARRRRSCPSCGHRVTTLEAVIAGDARRPVDEVALVRRADLRALAAAVTALLGDAPNPTLAAGADATDSDHEDW